MSGFFAKAFGGKKKDEAPTTAEAIQKLRVTEDLLLKKSEFLEGKIKNEVTIAKKNASTNKRAAVNALKRKKRLVKNLEQIDGTLSTIEFQREALENANTNTEVLKAMSYASKAMKQVHQTLDVDDVHDMMDDIQEQNEIADEISNAISQPAGMSDIDEDDLLAELEELEQEELDETLLQVGGTSLPDVPTDIPEPQAAKPKKVASEDDDDMAELAAWAS